MSVINTNVCLWMRCLRNVNVMAELFVTNFVTNYIPLAKSLTLTVGMQLAKVCHCASTPSASTNINKSQKFYFFFRDAFHPLRVKSSQ